VSELTASRSGGREATGAPPPPVLFADAEDPLLTTASPDSVAQATVTGVRWGVLARVGIEAASFASSVVLARLVSPVGFGHAATALGVIALASALTVEGFGTPLVQRRQIVRAHVEAALLLSLASGLALTALFFFAAPLLGGLLGRENVSLIELASPTFLAVSISAVPRALQQRRLRFRLISLIQMAALFTGVLVSISLAALGLGARALVLGQLANPAAAALIYLLSMPRVRPRWRRRQAGEVAGFGFQTALSSLLFSMYANADYLIVATELGPRPTGFYWRAFQVGGVYQGKISQIMLSVALPVYSRTGDLERMRRLRMRIVRTHASVIFPLLGLYVVLASLLVPLVWGRTWDPAIVPSQILAFLGMTYALGTGSAALLIAAGHPRAVLISTLGQLLAYVAVVVAFARYGLTVLCLAIVVASAVQYVVQYYLFIDRLAGIPMRQLWAEVKPALVSLLALFAAGVGVLHLLTGAGAPRLAVIAIVTLGGLGAYAACMRLLFGEGWNDLALLFRRVFGVRP
jgi:O-antigen/teichoic acid export membrane protein